MADGSPLAIAGLWKSWEEPDGGQSQSFTMTVKAEDQLIADSQARALLLLVSDSGRTWANVGPQLHKRSNYEALLDMGWTTIP
jgi:putative SOS response-associated peptidase YedK